MVHLKVPLVFMVPENRYVLWGAQAIAKQMSTMQNSPTFKSIPISHTFECSSIRNTVDHQALFDNMFPNFIYVA